MSRRFAHIFVFALMIVALAPIPGTGAQVFGTDVTYTTDADFDNGNLVSVNHDAPYNDQLQLDSPTEPFPFINVAASGRGTVVRVNTDTGEVVGEYRTAPEGRGLNPSRTTVDLFGNVWTANREEVDEIATVPHGSAVKVGLIVGGTRVDATGTPDPTGGYLAAPFGYNTCSDRDNDGLIRTSSGLLDVLDWPDITDGVGGADGVVQDADDECILVYQRLANAEQARHVSVDADNNVWVGGFPFELRYFYKLDGTTGAILDSFDADEIGCGGYGGLVDGNGVLWSIGWGWGEGPLMRYDPATRDGTCVNTFGGYGLGIDTNGYVWASIWENGIAKVSPDGLLQPGFPKPTWPAPATATATAAEAWVPLEAPVLTAQPAVMALQADPPLPTFWVAPVDDWVASMSPWTPGATISLTIEDATGLYSDSQTADVDGNFHFELWDIVDLQAGQVVTVSDGTTTKTHTVTGLGLTAVDVTGDTVSGVATDTTAVSVWVHGDGELTVTPASGTWTADFTSTAELTYVSDGGSAQYDDGGDATGVWWTAPRIQVSPDDDWVQASGNWPVGATVDLTIDDGSGSPYTASQPVDEFGRFNFELWETFDVQRGQVVTVSDGTDTKDHTVTDLNVDTIDVDLDRLLGAASTGMDVDVWVHGDGNVVATPDTTTGAWVADFTGMTDITYASDGGSQQTDVDGDSTGDWWSSPLFQVSPDHEWVQSDGPWTPGATISLTVDGGAEPYSDSQTADGAGNFHFGFGGVFDLQRGHVVTVSDGTTTKTHTVEDLFVDVIDVTADTVSGRAAAGTFVDVWVDGYPGFTVEANGAGQWLADFSGIVDLDYNSSGGAQQADVDGDSTQVHWSSPRFQVAPDEDWVQADGRWTAGGTISLTVEDGSGVAYSDSQTADENGWFSFNLWPSFDLERGHVVTVSDGTTTKTHTVIDLYVDGVDVDADTVFGQGAAEVDVDVWVHDDVGSQVTTTAGTDGRWTANFSAVTNLTYASDGGSQQRDDDGDSTGVWWASPSIQVQPTQDWVGSWNRWPANTTISITIENGGGVVHSDSVTTDRWGNFGLGLQGVFDVQRGHTVTASDATTTKTHMVFDLYITKVDADTEEVHGTAARDSEVEVQVHGPVHGRRVVTADGAGDWMADFSTLTGEGEGFPDLQPTSDVSANQYDDEGDVTWVDRHGPQFRVNPDDNQVWGWAFLWDSPVTVTIDDDADLGDGFLHEWSGTTSPGGDVNPDLGYDVEPGHYVTVSDGETTKVHLVTSVDVADADINPAADTITGTAAPGATIEVRAGLFQTESVRWVVADPSGNWTADFSVDAQDQPAFDIDDTTLITVNDIDEDFDATNRRFGPPIQANRGVAVTPIDNHVWVASSGIGAVTRLDNDGNVLKIIPTGDEPTGVAVDAAGKVWVTNQFSDNTVRIDPTAGADGLGAIDLTVDLGEGAGPYNYSDMTGAVVVGSTSPQGIWTVIQDSGEDGFEWGRISWNNEPEGSEPEGTAIVVEARTADTEAGLGGAVFQPVVNGELFSSFGRFIEVRVTLKASAGGESPVLSDIRVQPALIEVGLDIKPGSDPNSINLKRDTGVVPVAVLGSDDFDVAEIDVTKLRFGRDMASPDHDLLDPVTYADHVEDVNDDGYMDLVSHYRIADIGFQSGDTEACLVGETLSGIPIEGCDSVRLIEKKVN